VNEIVLDTNIVLDLFVFNDAKTASLKQALESGSHQWIATQPMRNELERVLAYPQIVPRLAFYQLTATDVLAQFDKFARLEPIALKASVTCKDADDQKFIDLAVAQKSLLLSKDNAVLCMAKRLIVLGVEVNAQLVAPVISR
jgi:putative PIN family toxin of toxin-antitoxin system